MPFWVHLALPPQLLLGLGDPWLWAFFTFVFHVLHLVLWRLEMAFSLAGSSLLLGIEVLLVKQVFLLHSSLVLKSNLLLPLLLLIIEIWCWIICGLMVCCENWEDVEIGVIDVKTLVPVGCTLVLSRSNSFYTLFFGIGLLWWMSLFWLSTYIFLVHLWYSVNRDIKFGCIYLTVMFQSSSRYPCYLDIHALNQIFLVEQSVENISNGEIVGTWIGCIWVALMAGLSLISTYVFGYVTDTIFVYHSGRFDQQGLDMASWAMRA